MKKTLLFGSLVIIFSITGFLFLKKNNLNPSAARAEQTIFTTSTATAVNDKHTTPIEKNIFDNFYKIATPPTDIGAVKGGIVPHHLLAGQLPAAFFTYLEKQNHPQLFYLAQTIFLPAKQNLSPVRAIIKLYTVWLRPTKIF